ncbi:MAG: hypothetical protein KBS98_02510 [Flavobacterium sp.]|nr:hypothetical protein [Candidatus Neoflavobacterium equi]
MSKKTKAFIYQFLGFAILFVVAKAAFGYFTALNGFTLSITAAVVSSILAPQFKFFDTPEGGKIFMKWIFLKDTKEI